MIYPLGGLLIGALLGGLMARRHSKEVLDILQWAAVMAMICGLIGLFIAVFMTRANL